MFRIERVDLPAGALVVGPLGSNPPPPPPPSWVSAQ